MTSKSDGPVTHVMNMVKKVGKPKKKRSELPMLPPCEVCGGKATGFHYGANTCEACKAFYRRTIERPLPLRVCDGACKPQPSGAFPCSYCRFQRCLQAGMSLKAVRRGRYTHQIKVKNILEAKKHVGEKKNGTQHIISNNTVPPKKETNGFASPISTNHSSTSSEASVKSPAFNGFETSPPYNGLDTLSPLSMGSDEVLNPANTFNGVDDFEGFEYSPDALEGIELDAADEFLADLLNTAEDTNNETIPVPNSDYCSERQKELQQITDYIVTIYNTYDLSTDEFRSQLQCMEAKYKEEKRLRESLFGPMKPLSWEEYKTIYKETGLDIDGRRQAMVDCTGSQKTDEIATYYVNFFKDIPGFKDLPLEDEMGLIRGGFFQFMIMMDYPSVNVAEMIWISPIKQNTRDADELTKIYGDDEITVLFFRIADQLQKYQLTRAERALLTVITLLSPDRCETEEGKKRVEYAQASLVAALGCQLSKTHPKDPQCLAKCLVILADLRYFSDKVKTSQCEVAKFFQIKRETVPAITQEVVLQCPMTALINSKLADLLTSRMEIEKRPMFTKL